MTAARSVRVLLAVGAVAAATTAFAGDSGSSDAAQITQTEQTGPYTLKLEVLPPEPFVSPKHADEQKYAGHLVNGRGADPVEINGPEHPNRQLAVFVMRDGHVVEDALVHIRYEESGRHHHAHELPVTVMWVAGTPRYETTHFGNNVRLADKRYDVEVQLNDRKPVDFHVDLSQSGGQSSS